MLITIKDRLHPFSHRPGIHCLVPRSSWAMEAFPTLLRFRDLASGKEKEIPLDVLGPVHPFTVEQDLDKGCVRIFGTGPKGYIHFTVSCIEGELVVAPKSKPLPPLLEEKLSLGMNKALDWDLVMRRRDLKEIFPQWLRLAAAIPAMEDAAFHHPFLYACRKVIEEKDKLALEPAFLNFFEASFKGILVPSWTDERHLGILPGNFEIPKLSPLVLLKEGAACIRSLFFRKEEAHLHILPCLPPEFHSGRFVRLSGMVDLEWSKKLIRRMIIRPQTDGPLHLHFQKEIRGFRLRTSLKERGRTVHRDEPIEGTVGRTLYLDNFQK